MITEKDMQYILTIANYGNLTKAADALFLSQPALSIHLKQLENSLGLQLFERKGRKMILTYAGEEFVKSAREITMKCRSQAAYRLYGTSGRISFPNCHD